MVVVRCTSRLLTKMKVKPDAVTPRNPLLIPIQLLTFIPWETKFLLRQTIHYFSFIEEIAW